MPRRDRETTVLREAKQRTKSARIVPISGGRSSPGRCGPNRAREINADHRLFDKLLLRAACGCAQPPHSPLSVSRRRVSSKLIPPPQPRRPIIQ